MKKIYLLTKACLFTAAMFMVSACTEDDAVSPVFPENETPLNVKVGDKTEVTFTANMDWELTSSALWCVFSDGSRRISGLAGEQKIELSISDEMLTFEESVSDITLTMGGESKVIAKVYRAPQEYEFSALLNDGETICSEETPAQILYEYDERETSVIINTNFDWKLSSCPDWLLIDEQFMQGKAGEEKTITIRLNPISIKSSQNGTIKVFDKTENERGNIFVTYDGMPEGSIEFAITDPWKGVTFSGDGKMYSLGASISEDSNEAPLKISVYENINEDLYPFCLKYDDTYGVSGFFDDGWSDTAFENNEIVFTPTQNSGGERKLLLLLLPKSVYDVAIMDPDYLSQPNVDNTDEYVLKEEYEKYLVTLIKQEGVPVEINVKAFSGDLSTNLQSYLPSEKGYDEETAKGLCGYCDINNIKVITLEKGVAYDSIEITIDALQGFMFWYCEPLLWETAEKWIEYNPGEDGKTLVLSNITEQMESNSFGTREMVLPISVYNQQGMIPYAGIIIIRE